MYAMPMEKVKVERVFYLLLLAQVWPAESQLSVTWNGTRVTGPILIYHDEILAADPTNSVQINDTAPGTLICTSANVAVSGIASWHLPNNAAVPNTEGFYQKLAFDVFRGRYRSRLTRSQQNLMLTDADHNGLWTCRENNGTHVPIPVGLYYRGGGRGAIANVGLFIEYFAPSSFTIVGHTTGGPPTTYNWFKNDVMLTNDDSFRMTLNLAGFPSRFRDSIYRARLFVTGQLLGIYKYSVFNRAMQESRNGTIIVKGAMPPQVTASLLTATSLNISWTQPDFSPPIISYTVSLTLITGSGQALCPLAEDMRPIIVTLNTSIECTGLEEFSSYNITVNATFNLTSVYDLAIAFDGPSLGSMVITTPSAAPTAAPAILVHNFTSRSFNVTWESIECSERNGIITDYAVDFQEESGAGVPGDVMGESFTTSGLTPHTVYTFRVAGVNSNGTGPFTSIMSFQTNQETPGMVSNFRIRPLLFSVVLTWNPPQDPNGDILNYEVTYIVNNSALVTENTTNLRTMLQIGPLTPSTSLHNIVVSAYTVIGQGEGTPSKDTSTLGRPPMVTNVQVEMASDTSVLVSWDHVDLQVSGYIVYHTQTNNSTERSLRVSNTTHSVLIQNLAYDEIYTFEVAVFVEFDGGELISQKSSITDTTILRTTRLATTTKSFQMRDIYITASATFAATAFLLTVILFILCCICRACMKSDVDRKDFSRRNSFDGFVNVIPDSPPEDPAEACDDVNTMRDTSMDEHPDPEPIQDLPLYDVPPTRAENPPVNEEPDSPHETHTFFIPPLVPNHYATPKINAPASSRVPPRPIHDSAVMGEVIYQNN